MVLQSEKNAKNYWIILIVVMVAELLAAVYFFLTNNGVTALVCIAAFVIWTVMHFRRRKSQAKEFLQRLMQRHPGGQLSYIFYEEAFGYRDDDKHPYSELTSYAEWPDFWVLYAGKAMIYLSKHGFQRGSAEDFGVFIRSKIKREG